MKIVKKFKLSATYMHVETGCSVPMASQCFRQNLHSKPIDILKLL